MAEAIDRNVEGKITSVAGISHKLTFCREDGVRDIEGG